MKSARRKSTDAELARITADAISRAVEFTTTIRAEHPRTKRMQNMTLRRPTLALARAQVARLESAFPNGRKALVYAITAEGFSFLVPADFKI